MLSVGVVKCRDCVFWYECENKQGLCRRYPPVPLVRDGRVMKLNPVMEEYEGCGEGVKRHAKE